MDEKLLFLRIGWMNRYRGLSDDQIQGGGAFVREKGFGFEIFNFQPFQEHVYGYVGLPDDSPRIDIGRLDAATTAKHVAGVLVVWIATSPRKGEGRYVVGWYRSATVHREYQNPPNGANRQYKGNSCGYYITASSTDAVLLPPDERVFRIPTGKGYMGHRNNWYADASEPAIEKFRASVLKYIDERRLKRRPNSRGDRPKQTDPFLRRKVEQIAVEHTSAHYEKIGYMIDSVERDNVGWDLNAIHDKRKLKLEVIRTVRLQNRYRADTK